MSISCIPMPRKLRFAGNRYRASGTGTAGLGEVSALNGSTLNRIDSSRKDVFQPMVIAHRGSQIREVRPEDHLSAHKQFVVHPENTLAAIEEAMIHVGALELDVNANGETYVRNGVAYPYLPVYHDDRIGRPFKPAHPKSENRLRFLPKEDTQTAQFHRDEVINKFIIPRLGKAAHPDLPDSPVHLDESPDATRVPTLDEVFERLKKHPNAHIYVELKTLTLEQEDTKRMEESVIDLIKRFGVQEQVTVISFNPFALAKTRQLAEAQDLTKLTTAWDVPVNDYLKKGWFGKTYPGIKRLLKRAADIQVNALLPAYTETSRALVKAAHAAGLKVCPWVFMENRDAEIRKIPELRDMGVDGVITNIPDDAKKLLAEKSAHS
jgi:glycerophosphoryl diester phosphodiesterase